jgi:hypothetical protein
MLHPNPQIHEEYRGKVGFVLPILNDGLWSMNTSSLLDVAFYWLSKTTDDDE